MAGNTVAGDTTHGTAATSEDASAHMTTGTEMHAAAGGHEGFPPFEPSTYTSQILWLAITFGALYLLMSRVALPRIGEILEVRRDRIESDLAEADRLRQKTDETIKAYEAELTAARQKAHSVAEDTRKKVKAETDAARAKQEAELNKRMMASEQRIQETKAEALKNVDQIAAQTAAAVVAQISGKVSAAEAKAAVAELSKE